MLIDSLTGPKTRATCECEGATARPIRINPLEEEVMFTQCAQLPLGTRPYRTGWPGCALGNSSSKASSFQRRPEITHLLCSTLDPMEVGP